MEAKKSPTGETVVTLSEEEREQLLRAIERLGQTFQLTVRPIIEQMGEALRKAAPAIREFSAAAASAREVCQRLDPAFSGPAEEPEPVRVIDPVTGQSRTLEDNGIQGLMQRPNGFAPEEESFPIRQVPYRMADWDNPTSSIKRPDL